MREACGNQRRGTPLLIVALAALTLSLFVSGDAQERLEEPSKTTIAVGPQYDATHVYVDPAFIDKFVASLVATFGGNSTQKIVTTVTPTPSSELFQFVMTPSGAFSVFGFTTPVPYPFGTERTGYLVTDLDRAVQAARAAGAEITVAPFKDPIGRDAMIRWPGGVSMQLYWHFTAPAYAPLRAVPENRVYLSPDAADTFIRDFVRFSGGKITSDNRTAPGIEIGRPTETYRRVRIESLFGKVTALVTDGHLPYPYGLELTGYEVQSLADTVSRAKAAGASVLVAPYTSDHREAAFVQFPGSYIAEVHAAAR